MKTYFDDVTIDITKQQLYQLPVYGSQDVEILELSNQPTIKRQLNKISKQKYIDILIGYGAWDYDELEDHETNKLRLLWIACGDLLERITK
jgi:hypothetical protein